MRFYFVRTAESIAAVSRATGNRFPTREPHDDLVTAAEREPRVDVGASAVFQENRAASEPRCILGVRKTVPGFQEGAMVPDFEVPAKELAYKLLLYYSNYKCFNLL